VNSACPAATTGKGNMLYVYMTLLLWLGMILYWIIAATSSSQTGLKSELIPLFKLIGSALIIYFPLITVGRFAVRFYRPNLTMYIIGLILCVSGVCLAIWARHKLGKNWSGKVIVQPEHHFIEKGPYRLIRHPIYSGVLLAMLGTSLLLSYIFSFAYVAFSVFGLVRKSKKEEELLIRKFPDKYTKYRERTKMLIPYVF
jgi:protein-S-isoprenylcysteine O-methyltransferase Ste14